MKYRKKPVEIEAVQFTGDNFEEVLAFTGSVARKESAACHDDGPPFWIRIDTLEGSMVAGRDDYVIRGVQGEFYPCRADIFEQTYEAVEDDARAALDRAASETGKSNG